MWNFMDHDITPDIVTMAKSIGDKSYFFAQTLIFPLDIFKISTENQFGSVSDWILI